MSKLINYTLNEIRHVKISELHHVLNFRSPIILPTGSGTHPLDQWDMERDDAPILRYIYKNSRPSRHLEFGTWKGEGVIRVLEECDAHVWTINIWEGERDSDGRPVYFGGESDIFESPSGSLQTDSKGAIGYKYLEANLGNRVDQIYSDSRNWDDLTYPDGFFDSVFVDGAHDAESVKSDLYRALRLLRPGGLLLMHDFVPDPVIHANCPSTVGVASAVADELDKLKEMCEDIFWIEPSWILCAIRKREIAPEQAEKERAWFLEARTEGLKNYLISQENMKKILDEKNSESIPVDISLTPILSKKGEELSKYWEINLYGWKLLDKKDSAICFTPTSHQDHIVTPFIDLLSDPSLKERYMRINLNFSEIIGANSFRCEIQDNEYNMLGEFVCKPNVSDKKCVYMDSISNMKAKIRLVLFPIEKTPHILPSEILVEVEGIKDSNSQPKSKIGEFISKISGRE